ncbi:MAG: hypothetical protein ACRC5F_09715 [Cetobacterium sp.]
MKNKKVKIRKTEKFEGSIFSNVNIQKEVYEKLDTLNKSLNIAKKGIVTTAILRFGEEMKECKNKDIELRKQKENEVTISYTINIPPIAFEVLKELTKEFKTSKKTIVVTALERLFNDIKKFGIDE